MFTGAGVSQESGIPTFRDAQVGLWAKHNPEELASVRGFRRNPGLVWDWYRHRRQLCQSTQPNPGHVAIAELESTASEVVVVTQNVDDLHRRAGSSDILELHGNIFRYKCLDNNHPFDLTDDDENDSPPLCPYCDSFIRPDVVWFGEALPLGAIDRAVDLCRQCDVMLVVGTSGLVQPAALLPYEVAYQGGTVIEINPNLSEISDIADLSIQGPSGQVLPWILARIRGG